jgi:hypothetical protein
MELGYLITINISLTVNLLARLAEQTRAMEVALFSGVAIVSTSCECGERGLSAWLGVLR